MSDDYDRPWATFSIEIAIKVYSTSERLDMYITLYNVHSRLEIEQWCKH